MKTKNVIYHILIAILVLTYSCSDNRLIKSYHPNGKLKTLTEYSGEQLKSTQDFNLEGKIIDLKYYSNENLDSVVKFDENENIVFKKSFVNNIVYYRSFKGGLIKNRGVLVKDSLKIGWWEYFDNSGLMESKREYVLLCDDYYLNQSIIFDEKGDTVYNNNDFNKKSLFYKFQLSKINDSIILNYKINPMSSKSQLDFVLLKNNNFCEEKADTVISLIGKSGVIRFKMNKHNKGLIFDYYTDTIGVEENIKYNSFSRKMYFDLNKEGNVSK